MRTLIFSLGLAMVGHCNPVPLDIGEPPHIMIGENVLLSVADSGVIVSGRYRFRRAPDADEHYRRRDWTRIYVPVPIPHGMKSEEATRYDVRPRMILKGVVYEPEGSVFFGSLLPKEGRLLAFSFSVWRADLGDEFEIELHYAQPVINTGDKHVVYYIPFLPRVAALSQRMRLRAESYRVVFESHGDLYLSLAQSVTHLVTNTPRAIAVQPVHYETIAVEIKKKPNKSPEPTPTAVTPRATESKPK